MPPRLQLLYDSLGREADGITVISVEEAIQLSTVPESPLCVHLWVFSELVGGESLATHVSKQRKVLLESHATIREDFRPSCGPHYEVRQEEMLRRAS